VVIQSLEETETSHHLLLQGELEHRSSKARFKRTSKKGYKQQLAQIERRQARIRRINQKSRISSESRGPQNFDPTVHHHIGVGENGPLHIGTFCRENADDPAVMVRSFYRLFQVT
jgi:hypothetical protein